MEYPKHFYVITHKKTNSNPLDNGVNLCNLVFDEFESEIIENSANATPVFLKLANISFNVLDVITK